MAIPAPEPGLVVRYDFLWDREARSGLVHGKDRPACLVFAANPDTRPRHVVLLPITHTPPAPPTIGIEIPRLVRESLGLDAAPCWVILTEYNVDTWPSSGLRPLPGRVKIFSYGMIPPKLFAKVKRRFVELVKSRRSASVPRS